MATIEYVKTLYLVTMEGYYGGYGSAIYALGIFPSKDKAKEAAEEQKKIIGDMAEYTITGLAPNIVYSMQPNISPISGQVFTDEYKNDNYIGGYIE